MKRNKHSEEFKEQALRKVRERGTRTLQSVADGLHVSLGTLKGWLQANVAASKGMAYGQQVLPDDLRATDWSAAQRLQALNESYALADEALHAWCRQKGLFAHQLQAWRDAFCVVAQPLANDSRSALRELQSKHDSLQREMRRKDKALAEAAALLVLQKKFQALWADEGL